MIERRQLLIELIEYRKSPAELSNALSAFDWDCNKELVQLEKKHLLAVLGQYVNGKLSAMEVEDWANTIECREDIDYNEVANVIHILANPSLTHSLTKSLAYGYLKEFGI